MAIRSNNLNLLPVLRVLLEEQSVSRASAILGLSQPATSAALARLRDEFQDPLLVQVGRKLLPTQHAKDILPTLKILCQDIDSFMQGPRFDPSTAKRTFVITATDYVTLLIGGELTAYLVANAPGINVQFVEPLSDVSRRLIAGEFDLGVIANHEALAGLPIIGGHLDRMVGVVSAGHPLAHRSDFEAIDLSRYPNLIFGPRTPTQDSEARMKLLGLLVPPKLVSEQFVLLPLLALNSDAVAIVPGALAKFLKNLLSIEILKLPGTPCTFDNVIVWSQIHDSDVAHQWFRKILEKIVSRYLKID